MKIIWTRKARSPCYVGAKTVDSKIGKSTKQFVSNSRGTEQDYPIMRSFPPEVRAVFPAA